MELNYTHTDKAESQPREKECQPGSSTLHGYRHFVIAVFAYLFLCECGFLFFGIPVALEGHADFRNLYTAGVMARSGAGHQLYDYQLQERVQNLVAPQTGFLPFVYPAYTAILFIPLSLLNYRTAYSLFFAVNLLLLWISARLMRKSVPHLSELWPHLPLALFVCFFPAAIALMHGQTSILLLALYSASFHSPQKGNRLRAGIFLGLGLLKIQLVLPFALILGVWRRWRIVAGFLTGAVVALLASVCVTGYPAFIQYWRSLFLMATSAPGSTSALVLPPASMPNLYGLAQVLSGGAAWGARSYAVLALLVFVGVACRPPSIPMAVAGSMLIARYLAVHDLVLLLPPIALALNHFVAHPLEPRARAAAMVCLILLAPPVYLYFIGRHPSCWLALALVAFLFCLGLAQRNPSNSLRSLL